MDNIGVDPLSDMTSLYSHRYFIVCGGGFLHEQLFLDEWATDAKHGKIPYMGAYVFAPMPVTGMRGGAGKPTIMF